MRMIRSQLGQILLKFGVLLSDMAFSVHGLHGRFDGR